MKEHLPVGMILGSSGRGRQSPCPILEKASAIVEKSLCEIKISKCDFGRGFEVAAQSVGGVARDLRRDALFFGIMVSL